MRITERKEVSNEKKQRNRRWFSLLLGICLLVSMQLSAFAESQSAEGIPEAVPLDPDSYKSSPERQKNGQLGADRHKKNRQLKTSRR